MAALSEIEKLEARFAENPDGRTFAPLADAYRKAKQLDRALELLTNYLPKHPDYLSAHIVLGRCYLDKQDDANAHTTFERVLGLDAENVIALKALADVSERTGRLDDARRWLMRLLVVDPMNAEADEDLKRLGGPLDEGQAAAPAALDVTLDLGAAADAVEPVAPQPAWSLPPTPEAAFAEPAGAAGPMADIETLEFVPPPPIPDTVERPAMPLETAAAASTAPTADAPSGFQSFDDQLQWGAGERQSGMIHAEDIAEAERRHEETTAAIEFLEPTAAAPARAEPGEPAPAPAITRTREIVPPVAGEWSAAGESSTIEMPPVTVPRTREHPAAPADEPPLEPMMIHQGSGHEVPAAAPAGAEAPPAEDLPLIMPEDVTPPEEMRRPSLKQAHSGGPPVEGHAGPSGEPMLTETMAELYLKQGFDDKAIDVYRRLLAQRPHDEALRAKLAALEAPPPLLSAAALGAESVGTFLGRIARASLPTTPSAPPPSPPGGPSPMDQAFAAPADGDQAPPPAATPEGGPPGAPARPATDAFSLDQIFGSGGAQASQPAAAPPAPAKLGASFDEFFGAAPAGDDSVRPRQSKSPRASDDDLSAFNAWLHGLKR